MLLVEFFLAVRQEKIPSTVSEFLDLIDALKGSLAFADFDDLYYLSRACLVKSEQHFDKFDKAFDKFFNQYTRDSKLSDQLSSGWQSVDSLLTQADIDFGDKESLALTVDDFTKQLSQLANQQKSQDNQGSGSGKGQGGGGSGQGKSSSGDDASKAGNPQRSKKPKAWKKRQYKEFDDDEILSNRNIQVALRRLRKFAREGAESELDIGGTISATANNAGYLDLRMQPERHNKVKVLLLLDVGGSMDPHIRECEALFQAARSEFKYLETFYFHNFIYQHVWHGSDRLGTNTVDTDSIIHKFNSDYKVIFVGDARMADYEINQEFGCVEFPNHEPGSEWMKKMTDSFKKVVWINPLPEQQWSFGNSIKITRNLLDDKMFPMSLRGLQKAMRYLN